MNANREYKALQILSRLITCDFWNVITIMYDWVDLEIEIWLRIKLMLLVPRMIYFWSNKRTNNNFDLIRLVSHAIISPPSLFFNTKISKIIIFFTIFFPLTFGYHKQEFCAWLFFNIIFFANTAQNLLLNRRGRDINLDQISFIAHCIEQQSISLK